MPLTRATVKQSKFNMAFDYPFELRKLDFDGAMQDVYDFFYDINSNLLEKGLRRLDDIARKQLLSGLISDLLTDALGTHARSLTVNRFHNGHPDLLVAGIHPDDAAPSGAVNDGIEIKSTLKKGGAVDTHGARDQWMCVFVYEPDLETQPASARRPTIFREVYLAKVEVDDFRSNKRATDIGTRTATLHAEGVKKLRTGWIYLDR